MGSSSQIVESFAARGLQSNDVKSGIVLNDDQRFLLYFIMGTYFGPDLKGKMPQKSVLQRVAERLPPYNSSHVAGSHIKAVEVQQVYYYILRKADQSVTVKLCVLHQFFQGKLSTQGQDPDASYPQFPDLFPPQLHRQSHFKNQYKIVENIVFINAPEIFYTNPKDIERFKRLTRLEDIILDSNAARMHTSVVGDILHDVPVLEAEAIGDFPLLGFSHSSRRTRRVNDILETEDLPPSFTEDDSLDRASPAMIFLPSHPTKKEWSDIISATKRGFALTGSAAEGQVGPIIRLMDIGECEDSYLFRVSLPGVIRDEREFSCEVEDCGKVMIRGVTTTGEKTVYKYSQAFEMQSQNLCPSGNFSISFQLPGPVVPQHFSGNFGIDGILEGIVMKGGHA